MRYQKIHSQIWHDEKFINLTSSQKLLFFYILTSPHCNAIGCYILPMGYISEDLQAPSKSLRRGLEALQKRGFIVYDNKTRMLLISNFLKHNPVNNKNIAICAMNIIKKLSQSVVLQQLKKLIEPSLKQFVSPYISPFEAPTQAPSNSETEEEEETEEETEEEKNPKGKYLEYVFLKIEEFEKLNKRFGISKTQLMIEKLNDYIGQIGEKKAKAKYDSHYHTILNWIKRDGNNNGSKPQKKTGLDKFIENSKEKDSLEIIDI
jgi:hypothetical protein|tara:strand:+ start:3863 stop:4648 length:786 start_codon:yes stop_codon:yes gene_type:complete